MAKRAAEVKSSALALATRSLIKDKKKTTDQHLLKFLHNVLF